MEYETNVESRIRMDSRLRGNDNELAFAHVIPAKGTVEKLRRETFFVGRVPSDAKRNEKPDNSLLAFSPDLRSRPEADRQGFSTLPKAGIQSSSSIQDLWDSLETPPFRLASIISPRK
jgi:hypothetical protein